VAFGLGGVPGRGAEGHHFRLAPATKQDALSMLDGIQAMDAEGRARQAIRQPDAIAESCNGLAGLITDFPERFPRWTSIRCSPPNPTRSAPTCALSVDFAPPPPRPRPNHDDIVRQRNRIMKPKSVAVIGARRDRKSALR